MRLILRLHVRAALNMGIKSLVVAFLVSGHVGTSQEEVYQFSDRSGHGVSHSSLNIINAQKVLIQDPNAVCIDGTQPGFYLWQGSETKRFTIHHEGGGWCGSKISCAQRSKRNTGSSKNWPDSTNLQGMVAAWGAWYLSNDPVVNPLMHNWTKILFKYCDGASFLGNREDAMQGPNGELLHFKGHRILRAGINKMLSLGMKDALSVVVNGGSAGGLAVYLHANVYAAALPLADVVALPDGGFFRPLPENTANMKWVYANMNVTEALDERCLVAHPGSEWRCILAESAAPFIRVPVFALQSRYDSVQTSWLYSSDHALVTEFGRNMTLLLRSQVLNARSDNAIWIDSCHHHTGGWSTLKAPASTSATSKSLSEAQAFADWWTARAAGKPSNREWLQDFQFPCPECCPCPCAPRGGCTDCCDYPSGELNTCKALEESAVLV